jgi:hypothetical protein
VGNQPIQFTNSDRLLFIQLYRWCPSVLKAMMIIHPEDACALASRRLSHVAESDFRYTQVNAPPAPIPPQGSYMMIEQRSAFDSVPFF